MSKLAKKFIVGITAILFITLFTLMFINANGIERYYMYEKKQVMNGICDEIELGILKGQSIEEIIQELEDTKEVLIVSIGNNKDFNALNEALRSALQSKGIGFQKFWLWDEDYKKILDKGRKIKVYNQGKLNYSILIAYTQVENNLIAVTMIVPDVTDSIKMINTFTVVLNLMAWLIASGFMVILVRRITRPLQQIEQLAKDIASQHFYPITIHTHDELEVVASSMNEMGEKVQNYQQALIDKNKEMEQLLDNVAHDLKTPIALIKVYATGIQDGIDDGTFLETIIRQNESMEKMVEALLTLSRMEQKDYPIQKVALDVILQEQIEMQKVLAMEQNISIEEDIISQAFVESDPYTLSIIFSNLLSNAIKYTSGPTIYICLQPYEAGYQFQITNYTSNEDLDLTQIWKPFYVGETSRNKALSGTGLGLAIVKKSVEKLGYEITSYKEDNQITFKILFNKN